MKPLYYKFDPRLSMVVVESWYELLLSSKFFESSVPNLYYRTFPIVNRLVFFSIPHLVMLALCTPQDLGFTVTTLMIQRHSRCVKVDFFPIPDVPSIFIDILYQFMIPQTV